MNFNNYLIVSDLDGTLFNRRQTVPERSVRAIEYFKSNGGTFTVATGRDIRFIDKRFPFIKTLVNAPIVTSNGSQLSDVNSGMLYVDLYHSKELLKRVLIDLEPIYEDATIELYGKDKIYVVHPNEYIYRRFSLLSDYVVYLDSVVIPDDDILRVAIIDHNAERIGSISRAVGKATANDDVELVFSESFIYEILPHGATKGNAVNELRSILGRDKILICAGDWNNDLSQLAIADIPVCPSNANESVRSFCKYTLCDCDEGIIADIVQSIENGLFDI